MMVVVGNHESRGRFSLSWKIPAAIKVGRSISFYVSWKWHHHKHQPWWAERGPSYIPKVSLVFLPRYILSIWENYGKSMGFISEKSIGRLQKSMGIPSPYPTSWAHLDCPSSPLHLGIAIWSTKWPTVRRKTLDSPHLKRWADALFNTMVMTLLLSNNRKILEIKNHHI